MQNKDVIPLWKGEWEQISNLYTHPLTHVPHSLPPYTLLIDSVNLLFNATSVIYEQFFDTLILSQYFFTCLTSQVK